MASVTGIKSAFAFLFQVGIPTGNVPKSVSETSEELVSNVIHHFTGSSERVTPNRHWKTLRRTVDTIFRKHGVVMNATIDKLMKVITVENESSQFDHIKGVARELFVDGEINWGRIVTLYAFVGLLAGRCRENGSLDLIQVIESTARTCISEHISAWVEKQGGWDTFDNFFAENSSFEKSIWTGLVCTFVGLGAMAAIAVRN